MNKLQIKAEVLATLRALSSSDLPEPSLLLDLKKIEDKKTVFDVLLRELLNADDAFSIVLVRVYDAFMCGNKTLR